MKIGIVGHVDHGKSCMTDAMIEVMNKKGIELVTVDENKCFDSGISITHIAKDEALKISNEHRSFFFTPPITRAERRKIERNNAKKRK